MNTNIRLRFHFIKFYLKLYFNCFPYCSYWTDESFDSSVKRLFKLICVVKENICCLYDNHHQKLYFQYLICPESVEDAKWGMTWLCDLFLHLSACLSSTSLSLSVHYQQIMFPLQNILSWFRKKTFLGIFYNQLGCIIFSSFFISGL